MMKLSIKKCVLLFFLAFSLVVKAQYATDFYVTDLDNETLKSQIQKNVSQLLTEINKAYTANRALVFKGMGIVVDAQNALNMLWSNTPFRCGETEVIERCLRTPGGGYQVRNIPLFLKQAGENGKDQYQEAVIGFNSKGEVTDFHLALSTNLYIKVLKDGQDVTDLRYRQMILDYVEQFRTAYNTKDLPFLEQIYSDDALIITGKVVRSVPSEMNNFLPADKVIYTKQSKRQYLSRLEVIFKKNKKINVIFDDIKIMKHPAKKGYYGVTLKQGYSSDNYSDVGYLFLLWDFTTPESPKIHVRTWQPEMLNPTTPLPQEEIFTCDDFDIQ